MQGPPGARCLLSPREGVLEVWPGGRGGQGLGPSQLFREGWPCPVVGLLGKGQSEASFPGVFALFWIFTRPNKVKLTGAFTQAVPGLADGHSLRPGTRHRVVSLPSGRQVPASSPSQTRPTGSSVSFSLASPRSGPATDFGGDSGSHYEAVGAVGRGGGWGGRQTHPDEWGASKLPGFTLLGTL